MSETLEQMRDRWRAEGAAIDTFHATMGIGYKQCAAELDAYLTRTQGPGTTWQPMETAPKDGRWVLTWQAGCRYPCVARWYETWGCWVLDRSDEQADMDDAHWQPLPTPPPAPRETPT